MIVYVTFDPLIERVLCVHSEYDMTCESCEKAFSENNNRGAYHISSMEFEVIQPLDIQRDDKIDSILEKKKPDQVVWDKENGYSAMIKSYPTNVGAPKFDVPDVTTLKLHASNKLTKSFDIERNQIQNQIEKFYNEYIVTSMIWNSNMSFKPIIGYTYHLYDFKSGKTLSLLSPQEWGKTKEYIGTYQLQPDDKWIKIN